MNMKYQIDQSGKTKFLSEREIYQQILKEIERRGYGLLLVYTNLGAISTKDASWAEVSLVGENHHHLFLLINPKSISHDVSGTRFVYSDKKRVGLREAKKVVKDNLKKIYPDLVGVTLYCVDINDINSAAEYWSEVEEAVEKKYKCSLSEFLKTKEKI